MNMNVKWIDGMPYVALSLVVEMISVAVNEGRRAAASDMRAAAQQREQYEQQKKIHSTAPQTHNQRFDGESPAVIVGGIGQAQREIVGYAGNQLDPYDPLRQTRLT